MRNNKLPPYFQKYLDGRFDNIEIKITELKEILVGNGNEGLVKKVEKHERWISEFTAKLTVISAAIGTGVALIFSIAKEVIADFLKIK